jgi:hypothetical protein
MSFFRDRLNAWWGSLDQGQHVALGVLIPCALVMVVVMILSLHNRLTMPFRASNTVLEQSDRLLAEQRLARQREAELQAGKDTDGDGITDLDEINVTKTSPYLADSDSDGVPDGEELRLGTDPLCPEGQDCYTPLGVAEALPTASTSTRPEFTPSAPKPLIEVPTAPSQTTPNDMRAYLLRTGLLLDTEASTLTDAAVIDLYQGAYNQILATQGPAPTSPSAPSTPSIPSTSSTNP